MRKIIFSFWTNSFLSCVFDWFQVSSRFVGVLSLYALVFVVPPRHADSSCSGERISFEYLVSSKFVGDSAVLTSMSRINASHGFLYREFIFCSITRCEGLCFLEVWYQRIYLSVCFSVYAVCADCSSLEETKRISAKYFARNKCISAE